MNDEAPEGYEDLDVEFTASLVPTTINCAHEAYNEADCTNPERCVICAIAKEGSVPIGHNYVGELTIDPTCSAVGEMTYTCSHDSSHTYTEDVAIDEDAHAWNGGVVTTNPTCTAKGVKTYTCTRNSTHTYTEEVDALGHKYDNACDADCNTCGETRTPAEHVDADENNTCDVCGTELPKGGLSGGAIAGIVIGSVAVLGGGGFALWWFVFRKKKVL